MTWGAVSAAARLSPRSKKARCWKPIEAVSFRRAGKQVLNVEADGAIICLEAVGDHLAVIGDNGKILAFRLDELPEMPRGKGVKLQSYREGGLRDALAFDAETGPAWVDTAGRNRAWTDWRDWLGRRAASGKIAPMTAKRMSRITGSPRVEADAQIGIG